MSSSNESASISLHGKTYRLPKRPTVVVCVDGFDPEYLQAGVEDGILPTMASFLQSGFHATADCAMPSLTNPNNMCIITGVPTSFHGISGNFYLDKETGKEHMILDDSTMRGTTILAQLADAGVRVAAITAKDKLRRIIQHGLSPEKGAICFSAQCANECKDSEHGISDVEQWLGQSAPSQYSGELSLFVLDAGLKLLQEGRADVFYLTLSDYIQHKYAPRSREANNFMQAIDTRLGEFVKLGAVVAVTGDHGMSDKAGADGKPNVLFLGDFLDSKWPSSHAKVICPITDPFVKHHGALGGFVRVHLTDTSVVDDMLAACRALPEVETALTGEEAAAMYEMPLDREGDIVVISKENFAVGSKREEHDLSQLEGHRLRSHGGLSEQQIPLLRSTPLASKDAALDSKKWRNFDIFDLALNY
ncbi:3-carboxymuconate cyclase protein [Purpureocillium lavendulum]|uniref:3-carboxymuconate cyclase protein n=1 Tax=Purpureocillium lavendulum TaxID=1247861 RepID=A0AB34FIB3_9HYPO|nr:3-carboxymuconate cyclase protein [Purpureocillium lavendulum]